jgi:hypothetical protein
MRDMRVLALAAMVLPVIAFAAERPITRADESRIQQIDPRLKIRRDTPVADPATAAGALAVPPPNTAVRCTPDNATSPECSAAIIQGARGN